MGEEIKINTDRIIEILKEHSEYGVTLTELINITGMSYSDIINTFEELENLGKLDVKSDGLSRIYRFKR